VWICPDTLGHIQVTARDARGRKQYRYHPRWRAVRDEAKYGRMLAFGRPCPSSARASRKTSPTAAFAAPRAGRRHQAPGATLIRVGNEEYARDNGSFGLTTFRDRHASITRIR
jgi:DNA topoisomerase-1